MQEKHTPSVCILVLSWDRKDLAIQCAESLLKSDYPDFKVIVIDNGSIDGTKEAVEEHFGGRVEVLRTPVNLGYSGGFNLGLSYAFEKHAFDYVMVINNDTEIAPDAVSALVKTAESDPKIAFVTGKVYDWKVRDMLQTCGKLEHPIRWNGAHVGRGEIDRGQYDRVEERVFIDDVYMLVKKEIYDQIGGYSTEFHIQAEEYDWQARAKKLGYKACFTPMRNYGTWRVLQSGNDHRSRCFIMPGIPCWLFYFTVILSISADTSGGHFAIRFSAVSVFSPADNSPTPLVPLRPSSPHYSGRSNGKSCAGSIFCRSEIAGQESYR